MYKKKISTLVAGGSGMVGRCITELLLKDKNYNVISSYNLNKPKFLSRIHKSKYKKFNFYDFNQCLKATKNKDKIFLLTMVSNGAKEIKNKELSLVFQSLRVNMNLIEAAVQNSVKEIIFLSSSTVYQPKKKPISESELDLNKDPYDIYLGIGWYYRYVEKFLTLLNVRKKMKTKIVRTSAIYGINDSLNLKKARVVPSLIIRMLRANQNSNFKVWGKSNVTRDFIYSEDVSKFMKKIAETSSISQIVNFSSGRSITIRKLAETLNNLLLKNLNLEFDVGGTSSAEYRVLCNKKVDKCKIKSIKINRLSLMQGLNKTIDWYKKYGKN